MSNNPEGRGSTATIKFGREFDAPWLVAAGSPSEIRAHLIEASGLDVEATKHLTLIELIAQVSATAQGIYVATRDLGARVQPIETKASKPRGSRAKAAAKPAEPTKPEPAAPAEPAGEDSVAAAFAAADDSPPWDSSPHADLITQLQSASDLRAFAVIWKANQEAFKDDAVKAVAAEVQAKLKAAA